jgi:hypothetical protein
MLVTFAYVRPWTSWGARARTFQSDLTIFVNKAAGASCGLEGTVKLSALTGIHSKERGARFTATEGRIYEKSPGFRQSASKLMGSSDQRLRGEKVGSDNSVCWSSSHFPSVVRESLSDRNADPAR